MEEREENRNERLKKQFSELEEEWTGMKTGKASSSISWICVEEAFEFVENSPRNLMLSLQNHQEPEELIDEIRSPSFRRKLFHDSYSDDDDDYKTKTTTSFSHSSCWSSNGTRVIDNKKNKYRKTVIVTMLLLLSWLLINGFDHFSVTTQINTLVPT